MSTNLQLHASLFFISSNFILEEVDFGVSNGGVNSGGVGGPHFRFLGGGGGVLNAEGFVFKSVGGVCAGVSGSAVKSK